MESDSKCNNEGGVGHEVTKDCPHNLFAIKLKKKTCRALKLLLSAFISFHCRVPRYLGGHVGVDADGWEHGEVEQEVPACEENQGGREGPGHKQALDKHSHGKNHFKVFQRFRKFCLKGCQDDETDDVSNSDGRSDGRSDVLLYRKSRVRVIM